MPAPFRKPRRMEEPGPTQVSRLVPPPSDGAHFTVAGQRRISTGFPCMQAFPERSHAAGLPVKDDAVTLGSAGAHHETESDDVLDFAYYSGWRRGEVIGLMGETSDGTPVELGFEAPEFSSQSDAESWLGEVWRELVDASAGQVTLLDDDHVVYGPMSLDAE